MVALSLGLGWAGAARAAEPDRCAAAHALTELSAGQQADLAAACRGEPVPEDRLKAALFRAAALPAPRAAALAGLVAPLRRGAVWGSPALARAQAALAVSPTRLAARACAPLRARVDEYVAAAGVEALGSPFLHDDPTLTGCLGDAAALAGAHLVALRADNVAALTVVAGTPGDATITWLADGDALQFGRARFFVVAVPPSAAVTAVARLRNLETPATWRGAATYDQVAWASAPAVTCVRLEVQLDASAAVFLDGAPVARDGPLVARTLTVTRADHQLSVITCDAAGRCDVRYEEAIRGEALQTRASDCREVRVDVATRARPVVAILGAVEGEACTRAPVRVDGLRRRAAEYLAFGASRAGHEFRDLGAYAAAADALAALRGRLTTAEGATGGAATGADGVDLLGSAGKEVWRQGIDLLLSLELQCVRHGEAWRYALVITRIALRSVFARGRYGHDGIDLRRFVEIEVEEFTDEPLSSVLADAIDRSLGRGYIRLLHRELHVPYRRGVTLRVAHAADDCAGACVERCAGAGGPGCDECRRMCIDRPIVVSARRISRARPRPALCGALDELRDPEAVAEAEDGAARSRAAEFTLRTRREPSVRGGAAARVDRVDFAAPGPGWYLVRARWPDAPRAADALCVALTTAADEVWADAALSGEHLHVAPRVNPEQFLLRVRLGYTRWVRPGLGLGGFLGYVHKRYVLPGGRPAWGDLDSLDTAPLRWQRHSVLVGGHVELSSRVRVLPFDLRLRFAPTLSLGVLRLAEIPGELGDFLNAQDGQVNNLDFDLNLHLDLAVTYYAGKIGIANLLLLGLDAVDDRLGRVSTDVHASPGVFIGLGVGLGGAP